MQIEVNSGYRICEIILLASSLIPGYYRLGKLQVSMQINTSVKMSNWQVNVALDLTKTKCAHYDLARGVFFDSDLVLKHNQLISELSLAIISIIFRY